MPSGKSRSRRYARSVRAARSQPLTLLRNCIRFFAGRLAGVATPLEAMEEPLGADTGVWMLSAGGGNVDILAAARTLIDQEPRQVAVLCGRADSPLGELCAAHPFVDFLSYPPPAGKDGFWATNSLLGFVTLLTRAYCEVFGRGQQMRETLAALEGLTQENGSNVSAWKHACDPLWERSTTLVLYGASARVGAIDLESKFTEAALGNLQLADYRNFAHGRHHWLAKRGEISGVLALVSDDVRSLAQRTLALIPEDIPRAEIGLPSSGTALASLLAALWITGWAGRARGIDPGNPGVPTFGRKLYHLPLPRRAERRTPTRADAAILRKGTRVDHASRAAHAAFTADLKAQVFGAIVLDYDGTVVDVRRRRLPPEPEMAAELKRLLEAGCVLGFATGRGGSVRRDLNAVLPHALRGRVLVGYYNGGEIAELGDASASNSAESTCPALSPIAAMLRKTPGLSGVLQTDRRGQITLEAPASLAASALWEVVQRVVDGAGVHGVRVMRSGHSVDVLAPNVSKLNVLHRVRDTVAGAAVLSIGDRGRWPGNDHDLLSGQHSLSVDDVSPDALSCWNLAPPGQRGVAVTLDYLRALEACAGGVRFNDGAFA